MDKYFNSFREMISLRGLTNHTMKSYSTYIRAYLDYLSNILSKDPMDVSWQELRDYMLGDFLPSAPISVLRHFIFCAFPSF